MAAAPLPDSGTESGQRDEGKHATTAATRSRNVSFRDATEPKTARGPSDGQKSARHPRRGSVGRSKWYTTRQSHENLSNPEADSLTFNAVTSNGQRSDDSSGTGLTAQQELAVTTGGRQRKKGPWSPYQESSRESMRGLLCSLQKISQDAREIVKQEDTGRSSSPAEVQLSEGLPASPISRQVQKAKPKPRKPIPQFREQLSRNPWARILASPLRFCQASGARLPKDLLDSWGFMKNPTDENLYLMPNELADLERLRGNSIREPVDGALVDVDVEAGQVFRDGDIELPAVGSTATPSEGLGISSAKQKGEKSPSSKTPPGTEAMGTRMYIMPHAKLLRHLGNRFTAPGALEHSPRRTRKHAIFKLLSLSWKHTLDELAKKKERLEKLKRRQEFAEKAQENFDGLNQTPEKVLAELAEIGKLDRNNIRWQGDIETRMLTIMQARVLAAFEGFLLRNGCKVVAPPKSNLALNLNEMDGETGNRIQEAVEGDVSPGNPETIVEENPPEDVPKEHFDEADEAPSGSIFLHIRRNEKYRDPSASSISPSSPFSKAAAYLDPEAHPPLCFVKPQSTFLFEAAAPLLPSLSEPSLIPPTITLSLGARRIPVFPVWDLLSPALSSSSSSSSSDTNSPTSESDALHRLSAIIDNFSVFHLPFSNPQTGSDEDQAVSSPPPPSSEADIHTENSIHTNQSATTTEEQLDKGGYVILIRSTAPGGMTLITEVWRLWRYAAAGGVGDGQ